MAGLKPVNPTFGGSGNFDAADADVVIWGAPTDCGAGTGRMGAGAGPTVIREASNIWNTVRTSDGFDRKQYRFTITPSGEEFRADAMPLSARGRAFYVDDNGYVLEADD